ncbi:MAG: hypothetical protein ACXVPN_03945 [Bacteroidia bacterium]
MRKLFYITLFLLIVFFNYSSFGQIATHKTDSICNLIDNNKSLKKWDLIGHTVNSKGKTTKKEVIHGFRLIDTSKVSNDTTGVTLSKVFDQYEGSDVYYKFTFYYNNSKIVKAIIKFKQAKSLETDKLINEYSFYYNDNILSGTIGQIPEGCYTAEEALKHGYNQLHEYLSDLKNKSK